jgi:hypothetical protein
MTATTSPGYESRPGLGRAGTGHEIKTTGLRAAMSVRE